MIDRGAALEAVIRHADGADDGPDDDGPLDIAGLAGSGDVALVPRVLEALRRFVGEKNFYGRDLMAGILAGIQGPGALPVLLKVAAHDLGDDQDSLASEIVQVISAHPVEARAVAREFAGSGTPALRRTALWALGHVGDERDRDLFEAALSDPDPEIVAVAVGGAPAALFDLVVRALGDFREQVRVAAVSELGYSGRVEAVAPVAALAGDSSARIRTMVAYALGRLGRPEGVPTLRKLIGDRDADVRERAVEALGSVSGAEAADALIALAGDEDPELRIPAAQAVAAVADPRVPDLLERLSRDEIPEVRAALVVGLVTADAERRPLVLRLAGDPDSTVRRRVATWVRRLAPEEAERILDGYGSDPDMMVRRVAAMERNRLG
ncbi:HEAT repeat domain-containing protein [Actinoplanes sp. NPDC051861]|uniref:HEAT repeat domain-containing protein n=1 Tax=Actinoplanes sp. NPDC051861 TaxID=3155170 RepID=UPI0034417593